jgi:hypothetical protein
VVLDGAFEGFPHNFPTGESDDGTIPLVSDWLLKWTRGDWGKEGWFVLPQIPWVNQMSKRNLYFRFGSEGDWFLVIDGDEVVESGLEETKELLADLEGEAFWVTREFVQKQQDRAYTVVRSPGLSPRLFKFREGLCYGRTYDDFPQFIAHKTIPLELRHLRFGPIRDDERRSMKALKQTSADFARVTLVKNPDRRVAGNQVRLIRFQNGLQYGANHAQIVGLKGEGLDTSLVFELISRTGDRDTQMSEYDTFRKKHGIES